MTALREQSSLGQAGTAPPQPRRPGRLSVRMRPSWLVFPLVLSLVFPLGLLACGPDEGPPENPAVGPGGAPPGFWFEQAPPTVGGPTPRQPGIESGGIGYADGYSRPPADWTGLRVREGFSPPAGPLVFASGHGSSAFVLSPDGKLERRWHLQEDHPELPPFEHPSQKAWRAIQPLPDGGLLAIHEGLCMLRLSADSKVLWTGAPRAHHDFVRLSGDRIAVLDREKVPLEDGNTGSTRTASPTRWLSEDGLSILSMATGETLARMSIWDALMQSEWATIATEALVNTGIVEVGDGTGSIEKALDPIHANGIALDPKSGQAVVFLRDAGALLWIDLESLHIERVRVGPWVGAHDPQPLAGRPGWWALFDNYSSKGTRSSASRVVATDGFTTEVLYAGSAKEPFFSPVCGSIARTPGNPAPRPGAASERPGGWVVTETTQGRAFGLTTGGEIAWEFRTPYRIEEKGLVAALLDMRPLPPTDRDPGR